MLILSSKTIIGLVYEEIANSDSQVNEIMIKEGGHLDYLTPDKMQTKEFIIGNLV